jgi:phage portal protein, lambda family
MIKLSDDLYIPPMGDVIRERNERAAAAHLTATRRYKASLNSRLRKNWTTQTRSANYELRHALQPLRARSIEECQNNPLFKKILSLCRSNIVGPFGVQLQVRARTARGDKLNIKLNKMVENLWWEFCAADTFSASGKLSFWSLQRLIATNTPKHGEVLIQFVNADNKFGFSIKTITADYLDENYNRVHSNGNRIIMSVEVNADNRPVAYHLRTPPSNRMFVKPETEPVRVPAEQMIHVGLHDLEDEEATRCPPWFYATLIKGKHLNSLQDAVLIAAEMGANTVGLIKQETPDEGAAEFIGDEADDSPLKIDTEPGSFTLLDPGMSLDTFDPNQPNENHAEHVKILQGEVATGNDVNYFELTGDLSEVNFSSARIGLNASRDVWRELQTWLGETVCTKIYHEFVRRAFLNGLLQITPREFQEIQRPFWRGRGWEYIEPEKDIRADLMAIAGGLKTRTQALANRGDDITDFLETAEGERKDIEAHNLEFTADGGAGVPVADTEDENGNQSTLDDIEVVNRRANAYGVGVRAGALTPQTDDEEDFRKALALPGMSEDAKRAWSEDKGVRRPITLVSSDGTHPAANAADTTDTANDDSDTDTGTKKKDKTK